MTSQAARRYRQRGAPIIHDTIDNETIAINQLTGAYYSLEGASALAWERLASGATAAQIGDALAASYAGDRAQIDEAVTAFLGELGGDALEDPAWGDAVAQAEEHDRIERVERADDQCPVEDGMRGARAAGHRA